jgi:integrase
MATGRITVASLNGLEGWLWCTQCIGFGARKQRKGVFFYCRYRHQGRQVMHSIGRLGAPWTPDTARNEARRLLGIVATGLDPCAKLLSGETFGAEVERYLEHKRNSLKPRSFIEDQRYLRKHSAPLHRLKLEEIDRRTIAVLLGQVETASGAITRNRLRSSLSSFWAWAIAEGLAEQSPVTGTAKADEGNSRDRVLTQDELRKLWRNLCEDKFSDIVRLLLLTGQRRGEISALAWPEVDLARGMIILAPARTKNGRLHELPLSTQALAIIERQPRRNSSEFLFSDKQGYKDWDTAKTKLDQRIGIAPWRLHDLRRTCATQLGELGINPWIIEAVLNHYSKSTLGNVELPGHRSGVAGVYQRAKYSDEMRRALQLWSDHIDQITA